MRIAIIKNLGKNNAINAEKTLLESDVKIKTKRGRVVIVGQFGVGKTSLKRSLFREKFNPEHDSTKGIELVRFSIDVSNFFSEEDICKGSPTQKEMRRLLADEMQKLLEKKTSSEPVDVQSKDNQGIDRPDSVAEKLQDTEEDSLLTENECSPQNDNMELQELPALLDQLQLAGEDEEKLLECLGVETNKMEMESFCDFGLWDFAGQNIYHTTHQVFMDSKSIYLLVADASCNLNDQCTQDKSQSDTEGHCWIKRMKYKDYLTHWLNSIHAHSKTSEEKIKINGHEYTAPLIILVATKKDKLRDKAEQDDFVENMRLYLAEQCEEAFDAHVFQETFIVDNRKSGTDEEDPEIQKLRKCLKSVADKNIFKRDISVKWLRLELVLKALKENKKPVVSREFFERFAGKLGIKDEDTVMVLKYFHEIGIAYFFEDVLVLDTEWLTSLLGQVISIKLGDVPIKHPKKERFLIDLRRHGILHEELLDLILRDGQTEKRSDPVQETDLGAVSQISDYQNSEGIAPVTPHSSATSERQVVHDKHNESDEETIELIARGKSVEGEKGKGKSVGEKVVSLLEKFDLVYELHSDDRNGGPKKYMVPSLLSLDKREALPLEGEKCNNTVPLCYHFSGGFLPEGFYYRLVVRCLKEWCKEVDETTLKQNLKYHHALIPVSKRHRMSLTKRGSDIVIVMWYSKSNHLFQPLSTKPDPSECIKARNFVESTMNNIIKTWMPSLRYEARVRCSCEGHISKIKDTDCEKWIGEIIQEASGRYSFEGHGSKIKDGDCEKCICDDDYVYHDVIVDPPYQTKEESESVKNNNHRDNVERERKYTGPDKIQCTVMPFVMDMKPLKTWFNVSRMYKIRGVFGNLFKSMPKLGVVAFVLVVVVFLWLFPLYIQNAVFKCIAIQSSKGIAMLVQLVIITLMVICSASIATMMCILYSRTDREYRNVRALFLVVASLLFLFLPLFGKEVRSF
ncbi:uncharacterized protein [Ptychodera flava]|uniref:uncharacterized protein n=1 Tax=Ptychodera flava TaxID=63121 RepID=UPI00396A5BF6